MSMAPTPDQSAGALGHSTGMMQSFLSNPIVQGTGKVANAVLSPLEDTGVRMGQGLARLTGAAAGAMGNTGLQQHIEDKLAQPMHNMTGGEVSPLSTDPSSAAKQIAGQSLIGGAMTTPVGGIGKGISGAIAPVAGKLAPTIGAAAAGAATGYAFDQGQQMSQGKTPSGMPGLGTAVGGALPVASGFGGALLKHLTGFTSGAGSNVVQQAFENPGAVQKAINEYATTPEAKQTLVDRMKAGISSFLQDRSEQYGQTLGQLPKNGDVQPWVDTLDSFTKNINKFGGQVTPEGLQFTDTTLTKADQTNLQQAYDVINGWKDTSTAGMDKMRQAVGNLMDDFKLSGNDRANGVLSNVVNDLKTSVNSSAPGYNDMLSTYGKQTQLARDVMKELNLGSNARPSTQLNTIMGLLNKDPKVVEKVQNIMGEKSDQFMTDLAGAVLSEWLPEGKLMNALRAGGELGAAGLGFAAGGLPGAAAAVPGLASMSPRIVGESAIGAGALAKTGIGALGQKLTTLFAAKKGADNGNQNTQ